jgi:SAM-dependent methyltransferase
MSGFSADWLALREPYDARARNPNVLAAVTAKFSGWPSLTVVDLACGTGSTLRALAPRLPGRQSWKLVDNDLGLLARASNVSLPNARVTTTAIDLARDLEAALDGSVDLVTTSALLDLVSDQWLDRLVTEAAARKLPLYAALTYNGSITLDPADPFDARMISSVNQHQRRDKGFGPALGPTAASKTIERLRSVGYDVVQGTADWEFAPEDRNIQIQTLDGWAGAARELETLSLPEIIGWLTRRRDHVMAGSSTMRVGHVDVFADPSGLR